MSSRGFAIVAFHNSGQFALATNAPFGPRDEAYVEHRVVSTDSAMGSLLVIMFQPHAKDVVELSSTEANEMIQYLLFCSSDIAFTK